MTHFISKVCNHGKRVCNFKRHHGKCLFVVVCACLLIFIGILFFNMGNADSVLDILNGMGDSDTRSGDITNFFISDVRHACNTDKNVSLMWTSNADVDVDIFLRNSDDNSFDKLGTVSGATELFNFNLDDDGHFSVRLDFSGGKVNYDGECQLENLLIKHYTDSNISYVLNAGYPTEKLFTGVGTITITSGSTVITILDRNLGATEAGVGCEDFDGLDICDSSDPTYGYYFQWGNNYGFSPNDVWNKSTNQVAGSSIVYNPLFQQYYSSGVFVDTNEKNWLDDDNITDLWGGNLDESYPFTLEEATHRRGPCPVHFHVPSSKELTQIVSMMGKFDNYFGQMVDFNLTGIHRKLLIPFAGFYYDNYVNFIGNGAKLWTSSPFSDEYDDGSSEARYLNRNDASVLGIMGTAYISIESRSEMLPIRCVYDYYDTYKKPNVSNFMFKEKVDGIDTISVCDPDSHRTNCITVMDKNLGATTNDINSVGSYGYHFQWGSNNGFEMGCWTGGCSDVVTENATTNKASWDDSYSNHGYDGPIANFIVGGRDYWSGDSHDNLWGGINDSKDNNRGFDIETNTVFNVTGRQGPCPDGYHVPSIGEVSNMLGYRAANYEAEGNDISSITHSPLNLLQLSGEPKMMYKFVEDFQIPLSGGYRSNDAKIQDLAQVYFWSSSPQGDGWARSFNLLPYGGTFAIGATYENIRGHLVRCFKNIPLSFNYSVLLFYSGAQYDVAVSGGQVLDIENILPEYVDSKIGHTLVWYKSGTNTEFDINNQPIYEDIELIAVWVANSYTITFNTDGGSNIDDIILDYGTEIIKPGNPSKDGYNFVGWNKEIPITMPAENMIITAIRTKNQVQYGGGGGHLRKDDCPGGDYSDSYYDGDCGSSVNNNQYGKDTFPNNNGHNSANNSGYNSTDGIVYDTLIFNPKYSDEMNMAYQYAYHYGITTKTSISNADMNGKLTRIAMAKMLSQYAINVLGMKPDNTVTKKFSDVSNKLDADYDNGVTLAYQLGIMGINMPDNKFRPYDYVTRAEFATALSRLLYNTPDGIYGKTTRYYTPHINKLVYEGILTNTDPTMEELRGYVMLMLMRSRNN